MSTPVTHPALIFAAQPFRLAPSSHRASGCVLSPARRRSSPRRGRAKGLHAEPVRFTRWGDTLVWIGNATAFLVVVCSIIVLPGLMG